jgi:hypothetical protein
MYAIQAQLLELPCKKPRKGSNNGVTVINNIKATGKWVAGVNTVFHSINKANRPK